MVLYALFLITKHPDFGFHHIKILRAIGKLESAVGIYTDGDANTEALADPLFDAELVQIGQSRLLAEFGYRGLWLGGPLPASKWIEIKLGEVVLRREALQGKSEFRYQITRRPLAMFGNSEQLSVVDNEGNILGVWIVKIPGGDGTLKDFIVNKGGLDKKGGLKSRKKELEQRQREYLALYERVNSAFQKQCGRPIFILYGTLLGQHRSGDFIPGDDDFDIGYVSEETSFTGVRAEAIRIIQILISSGFTVSLNYEGKPFRIRDDLAGPGVWLDNRPVFDLGDGFSWLHKHARLKIPLADFRYPEEGLMSGHQILKPRNSANFLSEYYGPNWKTPDPDYSNASKFVAPYVLRGLSKVNLTLHEQRELKDKAARMGIAHRFKPLTLNTLYPVD